MSDKMWLLLIRDDNDFLVEGDVANADIEDDSWYTLYAIGCYTDYSLVARFVDDSDYRVVEIQGNRGADRLVDKLSTWQVEFYDDGTEYTTDIGFWNEEASPILQEGRVTGRVYAASESEAIEKMFRQFPDLEVEVRAKQASIEAERQREQAEFEAKCAEFNKYLVRWDTEGKIVRLVELPKEEDRSIQLGIELNQCRPLMFLANEFWAKDESQLLDIANAWFEENSQLPGSKLRKEASIRGRIETMILKGLRNGDITVVEDTPSSESISLEDLSVHLGFVLKRLESEGKITLTPKDGGIGVGGYTEIKLTEKGEKS